MRLTVLGGGGAFPTPERGCSGYLVEAEGFRLLVDPGFGSVVALMGLGVGPTEIDAVFVSHGHADHCADLNPLLRARRLGERPVAALPVFALSGAADAVLALDGPMLETDRELVPFAAGDEFALGPFEATTRALEHFVPNVGVRLASADAVLAYIGDGGGDPAVVELADGADVLLAEATYVERVPSDSVGRLGSAVLAGTWARRADAARLVLTHLWPGTRDSSAEGAARQRFDGAISVAAPGLVLAVGAA